MSNNCFSFLENEERFNMVFLKCKSCEEHFVEKEYDNSIIQAGLACELITRIIASEKQMDELNELMQFDRLEELISLNFIPREFVDYFHEIRKARNNAAHCGVINNSEDEALNIHEKLFRICVWFYTNYGHEDFIPPEYYGPIYKKEVVSPEDVRNIIRDVMGEKDELADYPFCQIKGSYLLNELSRLCISSVEAVEDDNNLNDFKNYIHIDRSIQNDFIEELEKVVEKDSSHLVMLCGSVGDGKSHLLAYLKTNRPDLYDKFIIHNDATESFYINKESEYTLSEVLHPFDDDNIDISNDKFILAINLGILNNFIESEYAEKNYSKLKNLIINEDIFNSNKISKNISQEKISIITFSDYNLFELSNNPDSHFITSKYIKSLFEKITSKDDKNPFYRAYSWDKNNGLVSPIMYNYQMLGDENVQNVITDYIARAIIEFKKIISTRDLLNFIYDILVPSEIVQYKHSNTVRDFIPYLLPNMLFDNGDKSSLLNIFEKFDPTLIRNEKLDKFIIEFYTDSNLSSIIYNNFDSTKLDFLSDYITHNENLLDVGSSVKPKLIITLIRFALFYGNSNIKNNFIDEDYIKFLKYLYFYNKQENRELSPLFSDIKKAIFNLKGSIKNDYICIDELESFKVSKYLKIKPSPDRWEIIVNDGELLNRFKTFIKVYFSVQPNIEKIELNVDYPLYAAIMKLNKGYKPNKKEKDDLILFEEFIDSLINQNPSNDLIVSKIYSDLDFIFTYDAELDSFSFEGA